jgi:putative intracellular protease/amidase
MSYPGGNFFKVATVSFPVDNSSVNASTSYTADSSFVIASVSKPGDYSFALVLGNETDDVVLPVTTTATANGLSAFDAMALEGGYA